MDTGLEIRRRLLLTTARILCVCCVLFDPVPAPANPPVLIVDANPNGSPTLDDIGGTAVVRISHSATMNVGASGARFRIGTSAGFTGVLVSVEYAPGTLVWEGNVTDGILIYYDRLCSYFVHFPMMELTYLLTGTSEPCSYITVLPHPDETSPLAGTCTFDMVEARVDPLWVNWDWSTCTPPVATEQTTWGRVKTLYRN